MKTYHCNGADFECEGECVRVLGQYYREEDREALPADALVRDGVEFTLPDIIGFLSELGFAVVPLVVRKWDHPSDKMFLRLDHAHVDMLNRAAQTVNDANTEDEAIHQFWQAVAAEKRYYAVEEE